MRHPDEGTIHAWLDGALDEAEAASLEVHARECAACGALVAEARGLVAGASRVLGALDGVPGGVLPLARETEQASSGASDASSSRLLRRAAARSRMMERPRWMLPVRAAAALLLVAGGTAVVMRSTEFSAMSAVGQEAAVSDASASVEVLAMPPVVATASDRDMAGVEESRVHAPLPVSAPTAQAAGRATAGVQSFAQSLTPPPPSAPSADAMLRTESVASASSAAARDFASAADADLRRREAQRAIVAPLQMRAAPDSLAMPRNDAIVVGVVRDDHTGEPVAGASILLDNGDIGTLTDHLGRFAIVGTTTGVHRAQVRRTGYATTERELAVAGDSSVLDVRLTPSSASIAAALGPGYSAVTEASGNAAMDGARASERLRSTKQAARAAPTAPTAPTTSSNATQGERSDSLRADVATADKSTSEALTRSEVPLSIRAAVPSRRRIQGDAAGSCLSIALETMSGVPSDVAARTVTVRLLPTVSRDTSVDGSFAIEFPRAGDVAEGARGAWIVVPRANQDERTASDVQLHWIAGSEEVRMRLDWTKESPTGIASVRRGKVGVDARAIATRVECRTVK